MDKETAKMIMQALAEMEEPISKMSGELPKESEEDWKKLSKSLSSLFKGHFEISLYISNRFPELDPQKEGKEWYDSLKSKIKNQKSKIKNQKSKIKNQKTKIGSIKCHHITKRCTGC